MVLYEESHPSPTFQVVAVGIEFRRRSKILVGTDIGFVLGAITEFLRKDSKHSIRGTGAIAQKR